MATHDDTQPDAPDLGAAVQLDSADTLDGPAGGADALDAGYVPPDRPYALDEDGVPDTLDERLARERSEEGAPDPDRSGRLSASGAEVGVDGGAASAEEAAVHDVDAQTPADGEPSVVDDPQLADPELDAEIDAARRSTAARHDAETDAASVLDGARDAGGAAAAASGRADVGTDTPR
ncbi:hypothetical protein [Pseudonocardia sp.]|uniref:hypothetical protein n=1 Tax=Pseudonocardia sp. TaxID=60912 RepID=UPI0026318281|nr:hypothetical protein [Pseudonocardia sp.]